MSLLDLCCSNRGRCLANSTCACQNGYYTTNCGKSIKDSLPDIFTLYRSYIIVFSMSLVAITILTFVSAKMNERNSTNRNVTSKKCRNVLLIMILILCLHEFIHFIVDPLGMLYRIRYQPYRVLFFGIRFPMFSTILCILLIHWSSLHNECFKQVRKAHMITKLRPDFVPSMTMDQVIHEARLMNIMAIFLIFLSIVCWIYQILRDVLTVTYLVDTRSPFVQQGWLSLFSIVYGIYFVGFVYYGIRLSKLLSNVVGREIKKLTVKVGIATGFFFLASVIVTIIFSVPRPGPYYYLLGDFLSRTFGFVLVSIILSMFTRLSTAFPYFFVIRMRESTDDSNRDETNNVALQTSASSI